MKPTKNRYFCKDCGRQKMVFESERKADTFIKFNGEEIEEETGYKPERSYFCTYCCGWHVTSQKEYLAIKSRTERILDLFEHEKEKKVQLREEKEFLRAEKQKELKDCLDMLEKCILNLERSEKNTDNYTKNINDAFAKLEKVKNIQATFKGSAKRRKAAEEKLILLSGKENTENE